MTGELVHFLFSLEKSRGYLHSVSVGFWGRQNFLLSLFLRVDDKRLIHQVFLGGGGEREVQPLGLIETKGRKHLKSGSRLSSTFNGS